MLPMNKLFEDVSEFMKQRGREDPVVLKTEATLKSEIVLFAHDLSKKHEELVSVELVEALIIACQDSANNFNQILKNRKMEK